MIPVAAALAACLGCGPATIMTPAPTPTPTGPFADVSGSWTGTFESSNFATRTIALTASQNGNCVDGAWSSAPAEWDGAISGLTDATSYSGQFSFERPADGAGKCTGVATVSGPVGVSSLAWTGTTFTGSCPSGFPQSITITLTRQSLASDVPLPPCAAPARIVPPTGPTISLPFLYGPPPWRSSSMPAMGRPMVMSHIR